MSFDNLKWSCNGSKLTFTIKDIDVSIINSLRRVILADIPNIAFEFIATGSTNTIINKNTGPIHNEFLAHRLSMIPICLTPNEILDFNPENYKFVLKVHNNTNEIINITSDQIEIYDCNNNKLDNKTISRIFPKNYITNDFILINKLKPNIFDTTKGDELDIEMRAVSGTAKKYNGFCPVSICSYFNIIDEHKANIILNSKIEELKKNDESIETINRFTKNFENLDIQKQYYTNEFDEPNLFEFNLQSECNMKPEYLFVKACIILNNKLEDLKNKFINDNVIENFDNNIYEFIVKDESHTTGNLVQAMFYNYFIRNENKEVLNFIGYNIPHPLDNALIFRFGFNKINKNIKNFISDGIENIQKDIFNIAKIWLNISNLNIDYAKDLELYR
jgi:DNA-directed RNA polymerase subunit L